MKRTWFVIFFSNELGTLEDRFYNSSYVNRLRSALDAKRCICERTFQGFLFISIPSHCIFREVHGTKNILYIK